MSKQLSSLVCLIIISNAIVIAFASSGSYDSIECDPHSNRARAGRARLIESIPCDLSKQNYCNLAGPAYPWNAVKKFVYDNQGLVRRMYGDLRHIFVMQSEVENEVDFDEVQHTADKYSKAFNTHNQRQGKDANVERKSAKKEERKSYRNGDTNEPHFRPVNNKQRTKPPKVTEKSPLVDNQIADGMKTKATSANASETSGKTTKLTLITSSSSTTTPGSTKSTSEAINDDTLTKESDQESNKTVDKAVIDLFSNISSALAASTTLSVSTTKTSTTFETSTLSKTENENTQEPTVTERNSQIEKDEEITYSDEEEEESEEIDLSSSTMSSKEAIATTTTEAQLFQDSMIVQIPANKRGVNACPVKEEVVAPFWGNNTRGEVLALLNVYPFEQYINWEKCTHENEQMYCRKGCRCEQQYRLHRLLAYNPLDACRGIFSDWFRFPSCCICKCYDIPLDYRVTSRSPRGSEKVLEDAVEEEENDFDEDVENYFDNDNS